MDDYVAMLADLRQKREAIDDTIKAIEKMLELTMGMAPSSGNGKGVFFGMTIVEAAKKYLKMVNRPASTTEITQALEKGGIQHSSKDFYSSVYAVLRQEVQKGKGGLGRHAQEWTLTEEVATP